MPQVQKLNAIIQLIRLPNLIFIGLTQCLTYFFIIQKQVTPQQASMPWQHYVWLIFSTVLIAAAGYIINDYFDIGIDAINKPERVTIETIFKRRTIIIWHIMLNLVAILITGYLALHYFKLRFISVQLISIFLLVIYSTTFKRKLIIGNFTIACLTALTLISMAIYEPKFDLLNTDITAMKLFWLYTLFAFIITFIREIIKDTEDIKGDTLLQCKTIPLVWGINVAKQIVYTFIGILLIVELYTFYCFFQVNNKLILILFLGTFLPMVLLIPKLKNANSSAHFHQLSQYIKWITLIGILSIIFL